MNPLSSTTSNPLADLQSTTPTPVPPAPVASSSADRLYQLAALTAGVFLLASLL